MINTLIGKKIDQIQKFLEDGKRVPVTLISIIDNAILQVKTLDKDGYAAMQLGFGTKKKANKAQLGHSKKAGFDSASDVICEIRLEAEDAPVVGEYLTVDSIFKPGDIVTVMGTSKGKGFAGVVKRHNFRGGPKTHGQSDRLRAPGSIGQTTTPGRVYKGKKMAGRMGSEQVSIENLTVVGIDPETKMLMVSGLVPGNKQSIVVVTKTGERKNFAELLEVKMKRDAQEAIEAEKAAKIAEEEAAKAAADAEKAAKEAPVASETPVETAAEVVADATETVAAAEETVAAPAEETAVEEVKVAEAEVSAEPAAEEVAEEVKAEDASASSAQEAVEEEKK